MLVLSRKRGEKIRIGPNVTLTVVQISGDRVRLAFEAPHEVSIHREEVLRKIAGAAQPTGDTRPDSPLLVDCTQH